MKNNKNNILRNVIQISTGNWNVMFLCYAVLCTSKSMKGWTESNNKTEIIQSSKECD